MVSLPHEKLTRYLLVPRPNNDKSRFLAQVGFTLDNATELAAALRDLAAGNEALLEDPTEYGDMFRESGDLRSPSGRTLSAVTIWIQLRVDGTFRFVTRKPARRPRGA